MASSQVQISSSSPFGCVLAAHNRRDRFRDPNVRAATHLAFHNNPNSLRNMDHLDDCTSISNENSENHNINVPVAPPNFRVSGGNRINGSANAAQDHPSSIMTPRRSCVLDRWAAKQLHDTLSTIDQQNQASSSSPPPSDSKAETQTGVNMETWKRGASSLVQIWEKRLNHSSLNTTACSSRHSEAGDFDDDRYDGGPGSEDSFVDWHSNRTSSSSPPCSTQSRTSDAGESERVRVADIIRRLASGLVDENDHPTANEPPCSSSMREQLELRCFSRVISSPRIRGRQAFADLLMQMERDRQRELDTLVERRAVSKFPQRGRIQSLLRLRILKRGTVVEDQQRAPHSIPPLLSQGSRSSSKTIMHLRERFARVGDNSGARSRLGEREINNINDSDSDNKIQSNSIHAIGSTTSASALPSDECNCNGEVGGNNVMRSVDTEDNPITTDIKVEVQVQVEVDIEVQVGEGMGGPATSQWHDTPHLNLLDSTASLNEWKEDEAAQQHNSHDHHLGVATNNDWFTDISRPRSYWEDRRQTWYREMLDSNSVNDDLRQLIQRKTVSSFLCSDFRERMDQLMASWVDRQTQKQEEEYDNNPDGEEELWCVSERQGGGESSDDEEGEEGRLMSSGDDEARDYLDQSASPLQSASPSIVSSWSYEDNENGDDSNRAASTSSVHHFQSEACSREKECTLVSRSHPSIEMELIYDLRGQMEQLYNEMSELRKSIRSCMDVQLMWQESRKRDVDSSGRRKKWKREKSRGSTSKCCICLEMQVDSLLYRCGHMCSCMGCGKELQWSGGKCPICGAAIEDVVRAHSSSSR